MTVDIEDQVAAYANWLESRSRVTLSAPASIGEGGDIALIDLQHDHRSRSVRWLRVLTVAASALAIAALGIVINRAPAEDRSSAGTSEGFPARVEWYDIAQQGDTSVDEQSVDDQLRCRELATDGTCAVLIGTRAVSRDGVQITTDHGPVPSTAWQVLTQSGSATSVNGRAGWIDPASRTVGFEIDPGTRVIVSGAGVEIAGALTSRTEVVGVPLVFGDVTVDEELSADAVADRYLAAFVDLAGSTPCVGGIGIPWNNPMPCAAIRDSDLAVVIATPSPVGTIVVATAPPGTVRVVARASDATTSELTVTDVPGLQTRMVFGVLGRFVPDVVVALDATGGEMASVPVTSTGGAPLGFIPGTGATGLLVPGSSVEPTFVQRDVAMPHRSQALVRAPSGATLGVQITEDFWGTLPPDSEQRRIGSTTWSTELEDTNRTYVSLGDCWMVAVNAGAGAPAWTDDALLLLEAFSDADPGTVDLPPGWTVVSSGTVGERYAMTFDAGIAGAPDITLTQMLGSTAGPLLNSFPNHRIQVVEFRGSTAWEIDMYDEGWSQLVWEADGSAFSVMSKGLGVGEIANLVNELEPVTPDEWQHRYSDQDAGRAVSRRPLDPACEVPALSFA